MNQQCTMKSSRAFTLVEVLIALTIFAVITLIGYRTLSSLFDTRERLNAQSAKLRDLSLFFARIEADFNALMPRAITNADDKLEAALQVAPVQSRDQPFIAFTRAGFAAASGRGGAPQRIGYRLRDNTLELLVWPSLDLAPRALPNVYPALRDVRELRIRMLDGRGQWQVVWPAPGRAATETNTGLPRAIELTLTPNNAPPITRLFTLREVGDA
jgi:general secretion pathway protein J